MSEVRLYVKPKLDYPIIANVKVQDIQNSNKISKTNREIIIASHCFDKIKNRKGEIITEGDFKGKELRQIEIRQHINKSILDAGLANSWEAEDIEYLITSVLTDVLLDFSHLTTQEVGIAFRRGSREEYGKNYGISARAYYSWLRTYCNETKILANKSLLLLKNSLQEEVKISEEEIQMREQRWLNLMYDSFNEFKQTGEYSIYDLNNMLYDLLKGRGLTKFSESKRKNIWNEAKEHIKQMHNPLEAKDKFQRNGYFVILKAIKNNDDSVQGKISAQAKQIGLKMYLTDLSKKKKSLKEIIESNPPKDK